MWDKGPVAQGVASRLQEMIRSGELKAGQKLPSQRTLSEQLRVSRPTLREALMTLETLGLIQTLPARGTIVLDPTSQAPRATWRYDAAHDLRHVFQTRLLIEGEICRLTAETIGQEALSALNVAADRFENAWRRGDLVAHVEADLAFHHGIADACPNRVLASVYGNLQHLLSETQRQPIPNTDPERMQQSIGEHRAIITALANNDAREACHHMQEHIRNTARCAGHVV